MLNLILSIILGSSFASTNLPKTNKELRNIAVMIVNNQRSSGGTGSVIKSNENGSLILTNKHVCEVVKNGGFVIRDKMSSKVISYKEYDRHDLCIIKINTNFGVNLTLAPNQPKMADISVVSGFPRLYPNTITKGHFSDHLVVNVMVGEEECREEEYLTNPMCMFLGFKPIVKAFKSQHTSNLIQPGNSGSAVLTAKGELAGVVFAGSGELGFALIVPYEYVVHFLKNQKDYNWITPTSNTDVEDEEESIEMSEACNYLILKPKKLKELCQTIKFDRLYRKN
jgi:S1-C subfamily serine protease